ncbi:hypothetical protein CHH22_004719 [Escherichia coli]|nr:hypothetical protein [Escherichia coli]
MKKTLIAMAVVASAMATGSVMAANWTPGNFNASIEFGGEISQSVKGGWEWLIPEASSSSASKLNVKADAGVVDGSNSVWSGIGDEAFYILAGKTLEGTTSQAGMAPVINFSGEDFKITTSEGVNTITIAAKGKTETDKKGTFQFKVNNYMVAGLDLPSGENADKSLLESAQKVLRPISAAFGSAWGNGMPVSAGTYKTLLGADVVARIQNYITDGLPDFSGFVSSKGTKPEVFNATHSNGFKNVPFVGTYVSEFVKNSGTLSFPSNAIPQDWVANMTATVSYQ